MLAYPHCLPMYALHDRLCGQGAQGGPPVDGVGHGGGAGCADAGVYVRMFEEEWRVGLMDGW